MKTRATKKYDRGDAVYDEHGRFQGYTGPRESPDVHLLEGPVVSIAMGSAAVRIDSGDPEHLRAVVTFERDDDVELLIAGVKFGARYRLKLEPAWEEE